MALTGETVSEAAARYETQAMFQRRELLTLTSHIQELSRIVLRSQTASDCCNVFAYMQRQSGPDSKRIRDLVKDWQFSCEMAMRLRELEKTDRGQLLVCEMRRIVTEAKAALYDLI